MNNFGRTNYFRFIVHRDRDSKEGNGFTRFPEQSTRTWSGEEREVCELCIWLKMYSATLRPDFTIELLILALSHDHDFGISVRERVGFLKHRMQYSTKLPLGDKDRFTMHSERA